MINPMNDLTPGIKHSTLHGNHHAENVYCKDVQIKHGAGIFVLQRPLFWCGLQYS